MTLADLIPSLRSSLPRPLDPRLWPGSAVHLPGGDVSLAGVGLRDLAARVGSPAVVVDEAQLRARCTDQQRTFRGIGVIHTAGALLTDHTAQITTSSGGLLGVYDDDQLTATLGCPGTAVVVHADPHRPSLTRGAVERGAGVLVLATARDVAAVAAVADPARPQPVALSIGARPAAGITELAAHRRPSWGFAPDSAELHEAARRVVAHPGLLLVGAHCRVDTPFAHPAPFERAALSGRRFAEDVRRRFGLDLSVLLVGGGRHAVDGLGDDAAAPAIAAALRETVAGSRLRVLVEPGRYLTASAVVTLCRVVAVAHPRGRTVVRVDAGRWGEPSSQHTGTRAAHVVSRLSPASDVHAELTTVSGAALVHDALLPADLRPGDVVALPGTGNPGLIEGHRRPSRPAVLGVAGGTVRTLCAARPATSATRRRVG